MKSLHLELNLTNQCNFRCSYCYEFLEEGESFSNKTPLFEKNELIAFIDSVREHKNFKAMFDELTISFWGGEPLLEYELIKDLIEYYLPEKDVKFYLYTNGFAYKKLVSLIQLAGDKLTWQVSYDGLKIQNKHRKIINGAPSGQIIRNNIIKLAEAGYTPAIKPTIPMDADFALIKDAMKDFLKIYFYVKEELKAPDYQKIKYAPSPTFVHEATSPSAILENKQFYYDALKSVAELDQMYFKIEGEHFFRWFTDRRTICGAGKSLITLDRDYKIYTCHGVLYKDDVPEHIMYDPERDSDLSVLFKNISGFNNCAACSVKNPTKKCQDCEVLFCMRCNVSQYESTNKIDFYEKWTDMGAQNNLCDLWRINNLVYDKYYIKEYKEKA